MELLPITVFDALALCQKAKSEPVRKRSTEVVRYLRQRGDFAIIGVGGVEDGPSAQEKISAGADLVQVYSGMIYTGPGIVRACLSGLRS